MDRKSRIRKYIRNTGLLLAAAVLYLFVSLLWRPFIFCPFRALTGYLCPGCGVTHMFMELAQGHFAEAFACNQLTFCLLPGLIALVVYMSYSYIERGYVSLPRWMNSCAIVAVCLYIIFGFARNLLPL